MKITNLKKLNPNDELYNQMNIFERKKYFNLYSIYINYLLTYLKEILNKYDELLRTSPLNFIQIDNKEMDIYQILCSNLFKYFYIRNNLYLNRLTKEELDFLKSKETNQEDIINFIKSTYKKVIFETINNDPNIISNIPYGPFSEDYFAPNDALVIGIRYDKYNQNNMSDEDWLNNYNKQEEFIKKLINELEKELLEKLNITCKIIQYDDESIKLTKSY